jgi:putative peptidoglycan lipid II flippase
MGDKIQPNNELVEQSVLRANKIKTFLEQNAVQASVIFMGSTLVSRVLGLIRDMLFGAYFGTSRAADALSTTLPITSIFQDVMTGAISVSLITLFIEKYEKDKEKALKDLSVIFNYIMLGLLISALALIVFSNQLVNVLGPGFEGNYRNMVSTLIDLFSITALFWSLTYFLFGIAQSRKQFLITALFPLLTNVFVIISLILFHKRLGIYSYPIGMFSGVFVQFIMMIIYAKIFLGMKFTFDLNPKGTFLPTLLLLSIPLILQQFSNYSVTIVSNSLASKLQPGSIAALGYANKLRQLSLGILTLPLATSYYPFLSEAAAKNNLDKLKEIFSKSIRFASFLIFPAMLVSIIFAKPIVQIVFERGAFNAKAVSLTTGPFIFYSLSIFAAMVNIITMRVFYAMKNMLTPLLISIFMSIINIALLFPLINTFEHSGIPIAISITLYLEMFVLLYLLVKKTGHMNLINIGKSILKLFIASAASAGLMYGIYKFLETYLPKSKMYLFVNFIVSSIIFIFAYFLILIMLKTDESRSSINIVKKIMKRIKQGG